MNELHPPSRPGSDRDFEVARRAVEAGVLTEKQVESALMAMEANPGRGLLELLPLPPGTIEAFRSPVRPTPAEAADAMKDPSRRFGDYWLVSKIGEGGMGEVVRAWDGRLGRWVAMKFPKQAGNLESGARFEREARILAGIDHPNIAKVYEVGERDGRPFFAMQFIEGRTLDRAAAGATREQRLRWVRDAASAVGAAHDAGVIHRDLKPSNVMVDTDGRVFVLDFGLAKASEIAEGTLGGSRLIAGTPNYMSPEQAMGKAEPRSDIYGIGAVLYEILTGRPPFVGDSIAEVVLQVVEREPVSPRQLDPGASRDMEAIVLKCLEKEPARRYSSATELLEDVDLCLRCEPLRHARRRTPVYVLAKSVRRQPMIWGLGALTAALFLVLSGSAGWWWTSPGTLSVRLSPASARLQVDGREFPVPPDGTVRLNLKAGPHELRAEATNHRPATRVVVVRRRQESLEDLGLDHETGRIEVALDPAAATIELDGGTWESRPNAETGSHSFVARSPGCFELHRNVEVHRDATTRVDASLERGELWRWRQDSFQAGARVEPLPDIDGDGSPDLAAQTLKDVVFLSGAGGRVIQRVPVSESAQWRMFRLDAEGAIGPVLAAYQDSVTGFRLTLFQLREGEGAPVLWNWSEPETVHGSQEGGVLMAGPDLDGDGVREFVGVARSGRFWILNVAAKTARAIQADSHPWELVLDAFVDSAGIALWAAKARDGTDANKMTSLGALSLVTGAVAWSRHDATALSVARARCGVELLVVARESGLEALDSADGKARWSRRLPIEGMVRTFDADKDGGEDVVVTESGGGAVALDARGGSILWQAIQPGIRAIQEGPPGSLLVFQELLCECIDLRTGTRRWEHADPTECAIVGDFDRDGSPEIVLGTRATGLRCLSADGVARWTLSLRGPAAPIAALPSPEEPRIVFGRGGSFVALARTPRELWHAEGASPFLAAPVVLPSSEGPLVCQVGDWEPGVSLRIFDGRTGDGLRVLRRHMPPNEPPGFSAWPGEAHPVLLAVSRANDTASLDFQVLRPGDGSSVADFCIPDLTDVYAVPAAADLDGDGVPDPVISLRLKADVLAWNGATRRLLWRRPLGGDSWGGAALADLDGDGRGDVVVPADRQPLRALRGIDGEVLWESSAGSGVRHAPLVAGRGDSESPELIVMTVDGDLIVLEGRRGTVRWSARIASPGAGPPRLAAGFLLVPLGDRGVAAYRWPSLSHAWTIPMSCVGTPAAGDLDGDGRWEAVLATALGSVEIVDLDSGRRLWSHAVAADGCTAGPTLADLNGDAVLDILVADKGSRLTAISGRPTLAARRR